jgi:hypothetical protein
MLTKALEPTNPGLPEVFGFVGRPSGKFSPRVIESSRSGSYQYAPPQVCCTVDSN